jgi:hypothetical protein
MIKVSIMRRTATKPTVVSVDESNYLSLCQILESTDDVVSYEVAKLTDPSYTFKDLFLPNSKGFDKWRKIEELTNG